MAKVIKFDLDTAITIDDRRVEKLELDLDKINGEAIISLPTYDSINSPSGLLQLAGVATGMIPEDLRKLKGPDTVEVISIIRLFLSGRLGETQYASQLETSKKN